MDTQQIIKERLQILPDDIKQAIKSTDLATKFNAIANRYNLHIDQNGSLQNETFLVMIGLEPTKDYLANIERELDIPKAQAQMIANDVNKEIFGSIKESLQKIQFETHEEKAGEVVTVETPPINKDADKPQQMDTPFKVTAVPTPPEPIVPTPTSNLNTDSHLVNLIPTPNPAKYRPVEQAGQFTVEKPPVGVTQYGDTNVNKENVLKSIEDPEVSMIDHLLTAPEEKEAPKEPQKEIPEEISKKITPETTKSTVIEKRPSYDIDPYREQM